VLLLVVYLLPALLNTAALDLSGFSILALISVTLFCWLALAWRVNQIRSVFAVGLHAKGVATKIWFFRQRGQMTFTYTYLAALILPK
jgi:hypothetical protein